MRGVYEFNFPAFIEKTAELRAQGHEVFNPAERDMNRGFYPTGLKGTNEELAELNFDLREAIADDLDFICRQADAIYLLPGWWLSSGAILEYIAARFCGIEILNTKPGDFLEAVTTMIVKFFK